MADEVTDRNRESKFATVPDAPLPYSTIFATVEGAVEFATKRKGRVYVSVRPQSVRPQEVAG